MEIEKKEQIYNINNDIRNKLWRNFISEIYGPARRRTEIKLEYKLESSLINRLISEIRKINQ